MNKDLTIGSPASVLWKFCLPLFGSVIFQQLYNIADSLVAGKLIGENALAAVGNSYEVTLIFIAFSFGCNIGCSVIVSQLFGAKQLKDMKTAVYTTLIACAVLCGVLMLFGFLFCEWLLILMKTPHELMADSLLYLRIYMGGLPFLFFYNVATGIFSALGDSKTPFLFLAFSSTANIGVNILFVAAFKMGVAGVAWATFVCQGISCVLAILVVLKRMSTVHVDQAVPVFSLSILKRIAVVAIPSILQQSFISIGNIVIQGVINGFGPGVIAGQAAGVKLNNLVITSFTTFGNGISNFAAQNLGAGKLPRIREGLRSGIKLVWIVCIPFFLLYFFAGKYGLYLFLEEPTGSAMDTGVTFLRILSPFYFVISVKLATDGVLRGAGMMKQFMVATFTDLLLRVILAILLANIMGSVGIWLSWPIGWCLGTGLSVLFYRTGPWQKASN